MTAIKFKDTTTDVWHSVPAIKGDKGDKGDTGAAGADGAAGPSAVYVGTDEPTEADIRIWLDTDGAESAGEIFWCTYGETTYAEITAAVEAGMLPMCRYNFESGGIHHVAVYSGHIDGTSNHSFRTGVYSGVFTTLLCSSANTWSKSATTKVSTMEGYESNNGTFPTTKAVADYAEPKHGEWELIETITVNADTDGFTRTTTPDGTAYDFRAIKIRQVNPAASASGWNYININGKTVASPTISTAERYNYLFGEIKYGTPTIYDLTGATSSTNLVSLNATGVGLGFNSWTTISEVAFLKGSKQVLAGTQIAIYGVWN